MAFLSFSLVAVAMLPFLSFSLVAVAAVAAAAADDPRVLLLLLLLLLVALCLSVSNSRLGVLCVMCFGLFCRCHNAGRGVLACTAW